MQIINGLSGLNWCLICSPVLCRGKIIIWSQASGCAAPHVTLLIRISGFRNRYFLRDGGIGPMPNPQPGGPGFSVRVSFP